MVNHYAHFKSHTLDIRSMQHFRTAPFGIAHRHQAFLNQMSMRYHQYIRHELQEAIWICWTITLLTVHSHRTHVCYMVTFTINIPPMLAYIYNYIYIYTIHGSYGIEFANL